MNIAVLITCHNRREKTLACLDALFASRLPNSAMLRVWVVDDGSTDGTSAAIGRNYPAVRLLRGDGQLFWCGGMRLAWEKAAEERPEAFLWLNDDVTLFPEAVSILLAFGRAHPRSIIVGSCRSAQTGTVSYGGRRRTGAHPGNLGPVGPGESLVPCDTFEGNIVWVPQSVFTQLGPLAPYRHALGDIDYGYRAKAAGIDCWVAPGYLGSCVGNSRTGTWEDATLSRRIRWQKAFGIKGLPPRDWWRFCRRYGGARSAFFFFSPYCRILLGR